MCVANARPATAIEVGLDLELQPVEAALLGNLQRPGASDPGWYFDAGSGLQARADIAFAYLTLDYRHFYQLNLDRVLAGAGVRFVLPLEKVAKWRDAELSVAAQAALLVLSSRPAGGADPSERQNLIGARASGALSLSFGLGEWFYGGFCFGLGAGYAGSFGFDVSFGGLVGLKI
ncbi:MAG: hypothetical protein GYA21_02710 [Myxococcales bacterium]|nr:hypothetical protein [Myxococcales bacterium]